MKRVMSKDDADDSLLLPGIGAFKRYIDGNAKAFMYFTQMFDQARQKKSPIGLPQLRDIDKMLRLFNVLMTHAAEISTAGLFCFPFNAILDCRWTPWAAGRGF